MQNSGVLFDVTKCVGCGSCTVACKLWNDLEYEGGNAHGYDAKLGAQTWTTIQYHDATTVTDKEDVLRQTSMYALPRSILCGGMFCQSHCGGKYRRGGLRSQKVRWLPLLYDCMSL